MRKTISSRRQKQIQKSKLLTKENTNKEVTSLNSLSDIKDGLNEELVQEKRLLQDTEKSTTLAQIQSEQEGILCQLKIVQENLASLMNLSKKIIKDDELRGSSKIEKTLLKVEDYLDEKINLKTIQEYMKKEMDSMKDIIIQKVKMEEEERFNKINSRIDDLMNYLKSTSNEDLIYRLKSENDLLLNQLNIVQEELENLLLEKRALKDIKDKPEIYYGAGERVKKELPYRIGATMISHSHSLNGLLTLPLALISEGSSYYREAKKVEHEQPPIEKYEDMYEAERVKQHLSYKLGTVVLNHSKTLKGWVNMPLAIHNEVKSFRKKQGK